MRVSVDIKGEALLTKMRGAPEKLRANMRRVITRLSIEVQAAVKAGKLTGQVLHVRTGTLRRSINRVIIEDAGKISARIGTNVRYANVHEFGFDGTVNVRQFVRRAVAQKGSSGKRKRKPSGLGTILVRAHTRQMHMPERSFLRSTLAERAQQSRIAIRQAAREALK